MPGSARLLATLPVPTGPAVLGIIPALQDALAGRGPARLPVPADDPAEAVRLAAALGAGTPLAPDEDDEADPTALVLATSGSTGTPKGALLGAAALAASAAATQARLAGPGTDRGPGRAPVWLLALPGHHIAGLQVVLRAMTAGGVPTVLDVTQGFTAAGFRRAVAAMPTGPGYTSLVPTQLYRILADAEATAALAGFHAVLVGGAATPADLLERARAAGVPVVTTYGMSETCGGCVYDGQPLPGVTVTVDGAGPGRVGGVRITGAMVARGYRGRPGDPAFSTGPPTRPGPGRSTSGGSTSGGSTSGGSTSGGSTDAPPPGEPPVGYTFTTGDLGRLVNGRLEVVGRADDVLISGGVKIDPAVVEEALLTVPGVADAALTAVPDEAWGQRLVAVIACTPRADPDPAELRRVARAAAGPAGAPRAVLLVDAVPRRGIGKRDRPALAALAADRLGRPAGGGSAGQ